LAAVMGMDGWDIAIWLVAAYVAVLTLVRFMTARRDRVLDDLRQRAIAAQASRPATPAEDEATTK
jgi:uncharacterized membrane protein